MSSRNYATVSLILLLAVLTSCASAAPTVTSAPSTATRSALGATSTLLLPTDTAALPTALSATATQAPTATPVPLDGHDAGLIAFYSDRDGNPEIYVMTPDGSEQRRLTFNQFEDSSPDWSPDGSQIAFISDRDDPRPGTCFPDCTYQIYMINADGSEEHKLVDTEFRALHPDWNPDGTKLSFDTEYNLEGDIYVVNADGSGLHQLIEDGFWADWSPDGTQIAFASNRDGNVEIYVAEADGSNQRRLTENRALEYFPAWSPDGRRIAFARLDTKQIYVIDADGSNEQQLTHQSNAENPSWSPDGAEIVFQSSSAGNFEIYAVRVEDALQGSGGTSPRRLTENGAADLWPSWGSVRSSGRYLGQTPPGLDVEIFSPGIVSIEEGKEYKITISPDLREIVFTRRTPGGKNDRLWYSRLENGKLTAPELAPFAYDGLEMDPCFTPDGNRLYFNSWRPLPGEGTASARPNVWFVDRTEDGWSEPQFLGPPLNEYQPVYFSFANDGTLYFTRSSPRGIYLAEPEDGQYLEARRLPDEINDVRDAAHPAIAPDESYVIVDSAYYQGGRLVGSLYVSFKKPDGSWTQAASLHPALKATQADVYASPRISPDGKYLFFERYDKETDRSDIYWVSTDVIKNLGPTNGLSARARIAPATAALVENLQVFEGQDASSVDLVFLPDGKHLASFDSGATYHVWDVESGEEVRSLSPGGGPVYYAAFSVDGSRLAVEGPGHAIQVWDVESEQVAQTLRGHNGSVMSLAFSADGALLATADSNGLVEVWEVGQGRELLSLRGHSSPIGALAFSADGSRLASGSVEGSTAIKLWDVTSGDEVYTLNGHTDNVYSLAFSPDGSRLVSASGDGTLRVWDVVSGREVRILRGHQERIYSVAYSPDGTLLASGDFRGIIRFWDAETGEEVHSLQAHSDLLEPVVFSADGSLLASSSFDRTVKLWGVRK